MGRLVLLRHDTPDAKHHYDLMLERSPGDHRLLTFRLERRIQINTPASTAGELLGEHRAAYLTYEGEVSGGRGTVRREWTSTGELLEESPSLVRIRVEGGCVIEMRRQSTEWSVEVRLVNPEQPEASTQSTGTTVHGGDRRV